MKSILLHISDDGGLEARVQASLDLARAFGGHITCMQAISYEVFAPGDYFGTAMAAVIPVIKEAAEELRTRMEQDLANEDVAWSWQSRFGMPEHALLEQSAISDIVVVGTHEIGESEKRASRMVGELVMHARTPVLVVPASLARFDTGGPALVAWNGSTEACHALRAALPLLQQASMVYLATVSEAKERERFDFASTEGAEYLSRHGVDCQMVDIPRGEADIADALVAAAQSRHCAYMVMGAFGHSRLSEMLLGGVTRRALTDPPLPIVLTH